MKLSLNQWKVIGTACTIAIASFGLNIAMTDLSYAEENQRLAPTSGLIGDDPESPDTPNIRLDNIQSKRGQMLYQNHCLKCHESQVHMRDKRKAKSIKEITGWVARWSAHLDLKWNSKDISEVVEHINSQFYHFDTP